MSDSKHMQTVGAVVMIIAGVAGFLFFRNIHDRRLNRIERAVPIPRPDWNQVEIGQVVSNALSFYSEKIAALTNHDHAALFKLSDGKFDDEFRPWVIHYATNTFSPGVTVRDVYDYMHARYLGALMQEWDWTLKAVRAGERPFSDLQDLTDWHPEVLGLKDRLDEVRSELDPAATNETGNATTGT